MTRNIRNIFSSKKITSNVLIIDTIVKDVHEHKKLYKPLLCTTPGSPFIKRFASLLLELSMETNQEMNFYADMTKEEMLYAIVVFIAVIRHWLLSDCEVPVEKISATVQAMDLAIHAGLK